MKMIKELLKKSGTLKAGKYFVLALSSVLALFFAGCTSLQEVNIDQVVYSPEIVEYENRLCQLDAAQISGESDSPSFQKSCTKLAEDIEKSLTNQSLSKAAVSRLYALEGRVYQLAGGFSSKAKTLYEESVAAYKGDVQAAILGARLGIKKLSDNAEAVTESKMLELEEAIDYYKKGVYSSAAAKFDEAFISLDGTFRNAYGSIRDKAWSLKDTEDSKSSGELLALSKISVGQMLVLTAENSSLLDKWTGGKKYGEGSLYKKVKSAGLLKSVTNSKNELSEEAVVTKKACARFMWNLSLSLKDADYAKTKYSIQYKGNGKTSPVADIDVDDPDFDAVLGCVESEMLNLEDGVNFDGERTLSAVEFLECLKKINR